MSVPLSIIDQITFPANMDHLEKMIGWVRKRIEQSGFNESERRKIELAMEEALVNVILHAYPRNISKAIVEIVVHHHANKKIEFTILDKGHPFNPLLQTGKHNLQAQLEERSEGGLGIFFIRQCMDEVHYERRHPFNILTLVKTNE